MKTILLFASLVMFTETLYSFVLLLYLLIHLLKKMENNTN